MKYSLKQILCSWIVAPLILVITQSCVKNLPDENWPENLLLIYLLNYTPTWSVTSNPSNGDDIPVSLIADSTHLFIVGGDFNTGNLADPQIRVEKRNLGDGSLDWNFGIDGAITNNLSTGSGKIDVATCIQVDEQYIYIGGYNNINIRRVWHIEKRDKITGALITSFGSPNGYVNTPLSPMNDEISSIILEGDYIYIIGKVGAGAGDLASRLAKISKITGVVDGSFGTAGTVTINNTAGTGPDGGVDLAIDNQSLYSVGYDFIQLPNLDTRGRLEKRDLSGNYDTSFNTTGIITMDQSPSTDSLSALAIDDEFMYVGGVNGGFGSSNLQWLIVKGNKKSGALETGFAANGFYYFNPTDSDDVLKSLAIQEAYIFAAGTEGSNKNWQIRSLQKADGSANTMFGESGLLSINPGNGPHEFHKGMFLDSTSLYLAGGDYSQGNMQWRIERRRIKDGGL